MGNGTVREIASIIPYAYRPSAEALSGLEWLLGGALGASLSLRVGEPIAYGEEQTVRGRLAGEEPPALSPARMAPATIPHEARASGSIRPADWSVLLMSLAATPEVENHGVAPQRMPRLAHRARLCRSDVGCHR